MSGNTSTAVTPDLALSNALQALTQDGSDLARTLLDSLQSMEPGPKQGISQDYLDSLERVSVNTLTKDDDCPICTNRFCDDKYPLIVRLPCNSKSHKGHIFDLECIGPWLKMNSTCPLCRFDLLELQKKRKERLDKELEEIRAQEEEEEEDWDMYGWDMLLKYAV